MPGVEVDVVSSVLVSSDGGETWHTAELGSRQEQPLDKAWAWTLWTAEVPVHPCRGPKSNSSVRLPTHLTINNPKVPNPCGIFVVFCEAFRHRVRLDAVRTRGDRTRRRKKLEICVTLVIIIISMNVFRSCSFKI